MEDVNDPENQHRHFSHMLAVYPGRQIHPTTTPEFAQAAKVSVTARGNGKTGWSKVFKSCVFARLLDAESAYKLAADVFLTKTHPNLWTTHPPFPIDCNFGLAAAVNEMDMTWKDGTPTRVILRNSTGKDGKLRVVYQGRSIDIPISAGERFELPASSSADGEQRKRRVRGNQSAAGLDGMSREEPVEGILVTVGQDSGSVEDRLGEWQVLQ